MTRLLKINVFDNLKCKLPSISKEVTWEKAAGLLTAAPQVREIRENVRLFNFARLGGDGTRKKANVTGIDALVLDFDSGVSFEEISPLFPGLTFAAYSTYSNTAEKPRWRLVLPLAQSINSQEYKALWDWAWQHTGQRIDPNCKDPGHIFFFHSCPPGAEGMAFTHRQDGAYLQPRSAVIVGLPASPNVTNDFSAGSNSHRISRRAIPMGRGRTHCYTVLGIALGR